MMKRIAIAVAAASVVVGTGIWFAPAEFLDSTWVCERRAVEEFKQLEALAVPLAQKQVGELSRDLECWGREPQASVSIRLPKEVRPLEVLTLLGDEWQVDESRRGAITTDGVWDAASSLVGHNGEWFTRVVFTRI